MTANNEELAVIVQAESAAAVHHIESIVQVPGVDAVLIGPYDLSASLGKAGQLDDPAVKEAMAQVTTACHQAGMRLGVFGTSAARLRPFVEQGFTLLAVGIDSLLLAQAAGEALAALR